MILFDIDIKQTLSFAVVVFVPKGRPPTKFEVSPSSVIGTDLKPEKITKVAEEIFGIVLSTHSSIYTFKRKVLIRLITELLSHDNYLKLEDKLKENLKNPKRLISKVRIIEDEFFNGYSVDAPLKERLEIATLLLTKEEEQVKRLREIINK